MIASVVKVPIAELQNSFQQYMKALKIKVTRDGRMVCGPRSPYRQTSTFALSAHVIEFMRRVPAKSTVTTRSMTTEERKQWGKSSLSSKICTWSSSAGISSDKEEEEKYSIPVPDLLATTQGSTYYKSLVKVSLDEKKKKQKEEQMRRNGVAPNAASKLAKVIEAMKEERMQKNTKSSSNNYGIAFCCCCYLIHN